MFLLITVVGINFVSARYIGLGDLFRARLHVTVDYESGGVAEAPK